MAVEQATVRERVADFLAPLMFWMSILFLATMALVIVLWIEVQLSEARVMTEHPDGASAVVDVQQGQQRLQERSERLGYWALALAGVLWPIFVLEFIFSSFLLALFTWTPPKWTWMGLLACLCPPLRLGAPSPDQGGRIWLPRLGWVHRTDDVRHLLEKRFSLPMIIIALMILPILLVEFTLKQQIAERPWLRVLLFVSAGVIWFAFALEFIVMCSMARKKLRYCRDHWLDLAIILLPLVSFLRSLRAVRAMRLARLARMQQLTKMARIYRLRGLLIKTFRALLLLDVLSRLLRITPERKIRGLKQKLEEKRLEIQDLQRQIEQLEALVAQQAAEAPPPAEPTPDATEQSVGASRDD